MRLLIGIDDTDNIDSRGTGFKARRLGELLSAHNLAAVDGITRHQLLVDPRIRYTSHNSAACLSARLTSDNHEGIREFCRRFVLEASAEGSDAGLCIAPVDGVDEDILDFGRAAKSRVLTPETAHELAAAKSIRLDGLTGDGSGIIGALAAVALRAGGSDGRFIWLDGVRDLTGVFTAERLLGITAVAEIRTLAGRRVDGHESVDVGPWPRPVLDQGKAVFLVERADDGGPSKWRLVTKESIKRYSD